jgi:hypothetical protein
VRAVPPDYASFLGHREDLVNMIGSYLIQAVREGSFTATLQQQARSASAEALYNANATEVAVKYVADSTAPIFVVSSITSPAKTGTVEVAGILLGTFVGTLLGALLATAYFRYVERVKNSSYTFSIARNDSSNDLLLRSQSSESSNTMSPPSSRDAASSALNYSSSSKKSPREKPNSTPSREILTVSHGDVEGGDIIVFFDEDTPPPKKFSLAD